MEEFNELNSILPSKSILGKFSQPVKFTDFDIKKLEYLVKNKPNDLFQIGIAVWDRYCNAHPEQDKFIFGEECSISDPYLYKKVSKVINEPVIKDILYVRGDIQDPKLKNKEAVEIIIARTYPNILMIADVMMVNPYEPIVPQKYDFYEYRGLGLFSELLENARKYCNQHHINEICLTAANLRLKKHFEKYGFVVQDTRMGKAALELGVGIPMSLYM
ncbi:hypothetical protein ACLIX2_08275 [Proteus cibi]